jgi:hypothetical protein
MSVTKTKPNPTTPTMAFADELVALNEWHFFREFTYSRTIFRLAQGQDVEFADSLIWLGDLLLVYQLKERAISADANSDTEKKWFERKILRQATRQVRDTLRYLHADNGIKVCNHRNETFNLTLGAVRQIHKLVIYLPHEALPATFRKIKHHRSRTAGVIHILAANDYLGIVRTLQTPAEVIDYLGFREALINMREIDLLEISEQALVGQYLEGDFDAPPAMKFIEAVQSLDHRTDEWDISRLIAGFKNRLTTDSEANDYYAVVRELAMLNRNEMREFKKRLVRSLSKARADQEAFPYRMETLGTECGFVFMPLTREESPNGRIALMNITALHKYDRKLSKCIGISFVGDGQGSVTSEWCYADWPWQEEPELAAVLQRNNPFGEVKAIDLPRYTFREIP